MIKYVLIYCDDCEKEKRETNASSIKVLGCFSDGWSRMVRKNKIVDLCRDCLKKRRKIK